jgi:CRP-like cAMP-binding protein
MGAVSSVTKVTPAALAALRAIPYLPALPDAERLGRARRCRLRSVPKGGVIFEEGQPPAGVFVVRAGRVRLVRASVGGCEQVLRTKGAGATLADTHDTGKLSFHSWTAVTHGRYGRGQHDNSRREPSAGRTHPGQSLNPAARRPTTTSPVVSITADQEITNG